MNVSFNIGENRKANTNRVGEFKIVIMGFFMKQPVDPKKTTATYLWTGLRTPGVFVIEVEGVAQDYSYGFNLKRDPHFVGGLKIDVMGCTGPLGKGSTPYKVNGSFPGQFLPKIVISGSNGDFIIDVKEVPTDKVNDYVKSKAK